VAAAATLTVRFLLELAALVALGLWGWRAADGMPRILLAAGAPLLAAATWGTWVAPKARRRLADPGRLIVEVVVFGAAVAGLAAAGLTGWAWALAVVVVVDEVLLAVLGLRGGPAH
jgi:hypothetical protein